MEWCCPIPDKHRDPRLWKLDNLVPESQTLLCSNVDAASTVPDCALSSWIKRRATGVDRALSWLRIPTTRPSPPPKPEAMVSDAEWTELFDELDASAWREIEEEKSDSEGSETASSGSWVRDFDATSDAGSVVLENVNGETAMTSPVAGSPTFVDRRKGSSTTATPLPVRHSSTPPLSETPSAVGSPATLLSETGPNTTSRPAKPFTLSPHARSWLPGKGSHLELPQRVLDAPPLAMSRRSLSEPMALNGTATIHGKSEHHGSLAMGR